jgi:hypothetical protein
MGNIYNTRTKRRIYNVKWAPRGKYWYRPGSSAKYYPRNGWKSSYGNYRSNRRYR